MLGGATETLRRFQPIILIEISESLVEKIAGILSDLGYDDGVFWHNGKLFPTSETTTTPYRHSGAKWRNFLFKKK